MTLSPPVPPPLSTFLGGGGGGGVPAAAKRRRLLLSSASVTTAAVAQWTVHHQVSTLHFGYNNDSNNHEDGRLISEERGGWCCYGTTVLYVSNDQETATDTDDQQQQLAFHLRGCCTVESVTVESVGGTAGDDNSSNTTTNNQQLTVLPSLFYHVDPLQHVLLRPVTNPTATDSSVKDHDAADTKDDGDSTKYEYDADAQSSRGAAGMTTGLRAASMASNLGELRVWVETKGKKQQQPPKTTTTTATATTGAIDTTTTAYVTWKRDLERVSQFIPEYAAGGGGGSGAVAQRLSAVLQERSVDRRTKRLHLVASRLAAAAVPPDGKVNNLETTKVVTNRAFKVTIQYSISALNDPLPSTITNDDGTSTLAQQQPHNLAGLQAVSGGTPYVYTVTGVYGDHEGPRCWIPVLDSAAVPHRASHCLTIAVTAPVTAGLSVVGCGEDYGISETVWHDETSNQDAVQRELGSDHFGKIMARQQQQQLFISSPQSVTPRAMHVIPLEHQQQRQASLHTIQATNVWCSQAWLPIPCRSLGFAIGPFKVLEDPEYFGPSALDEKDDDDEEDGKEPFYDRLAAFLESVRKNGKGIRQVYLAPLFERKYIHTRPSTCNVNMSLLPDTRLQLLPLPAPQLAMAEQLDATVTFATTGVPHRALSLMRDVLAAPTYRTYSYTQIWIPNAVHGGCTSGALHHCPEVLVNPFLGGAIMDSRLLPPVGYRLPFFQGGRVLQFLQARCAIRGWITAALPMGGHDDVGTGYLLSLVESFIMSLYERGHGGQGEGKIVFER